MSWGLIIIKYMNIYLDIDGVLIKKDNSSADNVVEFLKYVTDNHDVYWLTTHCRGGENNTLSHLKGKLPDKAFEYLEKIKPTDWQTLKTEAIDFTRDFLWLDDYVIEVEKNILLENNFLCKLQLINLEKNPGSLDTKFYNLKEQKIEEPVKMDFKIVFSEREFEKIKQGYNNKETGMDERWKFVYHESQLYIIRSWTNWVAYKLRFQKQNNKYICTDAYSCFQNSSNNYHTRTILFFIGSYLLNEKIDFLTNSFFDEKCSLDYNSIHGFNHSRNVKKIGNYLASKTGADKEVINCFSYLHDIGRQTEAEEPGHGEKSATLVNKYFNKEELKLSAEQYDKLIKAISNHDSSNGQSDDITTQTCWDADRLDLWRLNIIPDPDLLFTDIAKEDTTLDWTRNLCR